jgi:two-component system sensor histidine kinase BaeS
MRLVHRITLAILATLLIVVALVAVSLYVSVERGFSRYIRNLEEARLEPAVRRLEAIYARDRSWRSVAGDPARFDQLLAREDRDAAVERDRPPPPRPRPGAPPPRPDAPPPRPDDPPPPRPDAPPPPQPAAPPERRSIDPLELPPRVTLYDAARRPLVGAGRLDSDASQLRLVVDGETVGWLGVRGIARVGDALDLQYLRQVRSQLLAIAAVALAAGLLAGWLLTRWILRPIVALRAGTRRLAAGDYAVRIGPGAADELGQVMRDFDSLAATLGDDARARRQWVADTSHELRTPITVLRGEIEAILDGVRPLDAAALRSIHGDVLQLGKLVADLDELARSDRGALEITRVPLAPDDVVRDSVDTFRRRLEERRLAVEVELVASGARVAADRVRLQQVLANLLENSARYTDEGGVLRITSAIDDGAWCVRFDDSPPGVPDDALPRLFERLYRVDASRSRAHGGSGLGLALCQRLIEAHDGSITARHSPLGGLRIEVRLPLVPASAA